MIFLNFFFFKRLWRTSFVMGKYFDLGSLDQYQCTLAMESLSPLPLICWCRYANKILIIGAGAHLTLPPLFPPFVIHPQHHSRHSPSSCVKFLWGSAHQHSSPPSPLPNLPPPSFLTDGFAPPVLRRVGLERSKGAEREEWIWWTKEREGPWLLSLPCWRPG